MNRLAVFLCLVMAAMCVQASPKVNVYHPNSSKPRAGLRANDTILAEAYYNKIGMVDPSGNFISDKINPDGYYDVELGSGKRWNLIDSCGNFYSNTFSNYPFRRIGQYFLGSNNTTAWLISLEGENVLPAKRLKLVSKKLQMVEAYQDSANITVLYDRSLNPVATLEKECYCVDYHHVIYAGAFNKYDRVSLQSLNCRGELGLKIPGDPYPIYIEDVASKKDLKKLKSIYPELPPLVIVKKSDKFNSIYFLDSLLCDNAPRQDTFEKSIKKVWKRLMSAISEPYFVDYYKNRYYEPAMEAERAAAEPIKRDSVPAAPKLEVRESGGKYQFVRNGKPMEHNEKLYTSVDRIPMTNLYAAYDDSVCYVVDRNGVITSTIGCVTVEPVELWWKTHEPSLMFTYPSGKQIRTASGLNYTHLYDDIILYRDSDDKIIGMYFYKDGKWAYVSIFDAGSPTFYDYIDEFDANGQARVYYDGFSGVIDTKANKVSDLCGNLYKSADKSGASPAERVAILQKVIEVAGKVDEQKYLAPSYRKMAEIYEEAGCVDDAIDAYEWADINGDKNAESDARRLKNDKIIGALNQLAQSLNNMAVAMGGDPSQIAVASPSLTGAGSFSAASSSSLEGQYRNWERRAKGIYDSLTGTGYKTRKNGRDSGGSAAGTKAPGSFIAQKRLLREAQDEMQKIRRKAAQDGIIIPQSQYESVGVSF